MDWDEQWEAIQEALYHTTRDQLNRFAANHPQERFIGFAFDCNADYGEVLLSLNTKAHHEASAPSGDLNRYRWSLGDWKYPAFNSEAPYEAGWEKRMAEVSG